MFFSFILNLYYILSQFFDSECSYQVTEKNTFKLSGTVLSNAVLEEKDAKSSKKIWEGQNYSALVYMLRSHFLFSIYRGIPQKTKDKRGRSLVATKPKDSNPERKAETEHPN